MQRQVDPSKHNRVLRTSREWCAYFQTNGKQLRTIPWEGGLFVTSRELAVIGESIQTFQLGESGTGQHILRAAERYSTRSGDSDYPKALRMLFAEEQRHARDLGRLLELLGLPQIERHWSDGVFRSLRHIAGLEGAISILLTPELIAKIYYAALRQATPALILRRLCEQILKDEVMHIRFQCETLAQLRRSRSRWRLRWSERLHGAFYTGACVAFWISHRKTMRAGRFGWRRFWRRARHEWMTAKKIMDPVRYVVPNS